MTKRINHAPSFKAKVALAALSSGKAIPELSSAQVELEQALRICRHPAARLLRALWRAMRFWR
jgi:hypothetical protein